MPVVDQIFNGVTIAAGGSSRSEWITLDSDYNAHGTNGKIESGLGIIDVSYELADMQRDDFAKSQGNFITGLTNGGADDPFKKNMNIKPSAYIRYTVREISGLNSAVFSMFMIQTGRGA